MKTLKKVFLMVALGLIFNVSAQNISGVATYKSHRKFQLAMDGNAIPAEQKKMIQAQLEKQFQKEYCLTFNGDESLFEEVAKLGAPNQINPMVQVQNAKGSDVIYKDIKFKVYTNETEMLGKFFLIKDKLKNRNWTLTDETKIIGDYTCYKAVFTDDYEVKRVTESGELKDIKEQRTVTAWYTPAIAVGHGPSEYFGLPGLIMEFTDGILTMVCNKVALNTSAPVAIEAPTKGKVVTQNEYDTIKKQKEAEMMEQFKSTAHGNGGSLVIGLGG